MKQRFIITTICIVTILAFQNCTTAILDEGNSTDLPPITRIVTYDAEVQNIMFNRCITCHGGSAPQAGLDLSTYLNTRASAEMGPLIQRMNNVASPMPPNGLVSPELRQIMDKWVSDGFPEN